MNISRLAMATTLAATVLFQQQADGQQRFTVEGIVDSYLEHIGGLDRLMAIKSTRIEETSKEAEGKSAMPLNVRVTRGKKYLLTYSDGTRFGFNGETRWFKQHLGNGTFGPTVRCADSMHFVARDPIEFALWLEQNQDCLRIDKRSDPMNGGFILTVHPPDELPEDQVRNWPREVVFAGDTLLLKSVRFDSMEYAFADYRQLENLRVPFRRTDKNLDPKNRRNVISTIKSIDFNIDVDEQIFELPD